MSLTLGSFYAPIMTNLMAVRENCFDDILAPPFFFCDLLIDLALHLCSRLSLSVFILQ